MKIKESVSDFQQVPADGAALIREREQYQLEQPYEATDRPKVLNQIFEIISGLGLVSGPGCGSVFYYLGGFLCTFGFVGTLLIILAFLTQYKLNATLMALQESSEAVDEAKTNNNFRTLSIPKPF